MGQFLLRCSIALDTFIQAFFRDGVIGVTISSRIGTAAAHGHRWGKIGWWLLDHTWPFGKVNGVSHCVLAIQSDKMRAVYAIRELSDPVVTEYINRPPQ